MTRRTRSSILRATLLGLGTFFALAWVLHTLSRVLVVGIDETAFMREKIDEGFSPSSFWYSSITIHAASAAIAIVAGVIAFWSLKARWKRHRMAGKVYVVSVLLSAVAGFPITASATGGLVSSVGFMLLNTAWLITTGVAYLAIRRRQIDRHRRWTIRSYAVTLANLTLTITKHPFGIVLGDEIAGYVAAVWLAAPLNLSIAAAFTRPDPSQTTVTLDGSG